jgi:fatty aldehyde decarbonylase
MDMQLTPAARSAYADILSHAITGELIGMDNYAALAAAIDDVEAKIEAVEHADNERRHALAFLNAAKRLDVPLKVDTDSIYWRRLRDVFRRYIEEREFVACYIAQELMIESIAVSMYRHAGRATEAFLGKLFNAIAADEQGHRSHCIEDLRSERAKNPEAFDQLLYRVHGDLMTTVSDLLSTKPQPDACGVCSDGCVKQKLSDVNMDLRQLRGGAFEHYLQMLDEIGVPGDVSLKWMCELSTP